MEPDEYGDDLAFDSSETQVVSGFDTGAFFANRYRLEEQLGVGAMGKVYRATDMLKDRVVAIKVLHADKAAKANVRERFLREAEILENLGHPQIVAILDHGQAPDGTDYLAMELLEGTSLKEYVRDQGPLSPEAFLPILVMVCDAIGAAHEQGVIHRDLKPDNVLIHQRDGELSAKVVDFGLSRLSTTDRITKTGVMIGTPRYMAPEQIRSAKDADERTDIYACGVLAHESLTGASPFPAEDAGQLLGCVIENRVLKLEDLRPELPPALGPVVRRAMAKEPKDRFATIGAFAEAFAVVIGRPTGRSLLVKDRALFEAVNEPPPRPVELEPARRDDGPPRFTVPAPEPTGPLRAARVAPRAKSSSTKPLIIAAVFVVALVVVACLGTAAAIGLRGVLDGGHPVEVMERIDVP